MKYLMQVSIIKIPIDIFQVYSYVLIYINYTSIS